MSWYIFIALLFTARAQAAADSAADLTVYAYDSFAAEGGLGPKILPIFERSCGCHVRVLASGDGGQLLARLQLDSERHHPGAQVVVGLDQQTWPRAKALLEDWGTWIPKGYSAIPRPLQVGAGFLPFDYGYFALMGDRHAFEELKLPFPDKAIPLRQLSDPQFSRKILLEDPRTSTPGLAFVLMTQTLIGADFSSYWKKFRHQWLTLAPGWSVAYGLFLKEQAPLVWSYTTSQAYHREHGDQAARYSAILLEEGAPMQIEGAALVRGGAISERSRQLAREFLEFLLSGEVQSLIPRQNWMFPVSAKVELPDSFKDLPKPSHRIPMASDPAEIKKILSDWNKAVGQGQ